jgi:hypothetical protein
MSKYTAYLFVITDSQGASLGAHPDSQTVSLGDWVNKDKK